MEPMRYSLDNKILSFTPEWDAHLDGRWEGNVYVRDTIPKWKGSITITYGGLTTNFLAPSDVETLKSIILEFNEDDEYNNLKGPGINLDNIDEKEWSELFDDLNQSLNDSKPTQSVFAVTHSKDAVFGEEGNEVAISCEWLNGEGEGWTLLTYFTTPMNQYSITHRPDREDVDLALADLNVNLPVSDKKAILDHIHDKHNNRPKISAKDSYYGI